MKLNTLSRLTALLLAMLFLTTSVAMAAETVSEDDYTIQDYAAQLAAETGMCETCAQEMEDYYLSQYNCKPMSEDQCFYNDLVALDGAGAIYDFFIDLKQKEKEALEATDYDTADHYYYLRKAYVNAHAAHVEELEAESILCYSCSQSFADYVPVVPGPTHTQGTCPWYSATTYIPVTSSADVSTPEALVALDSTQITLAASDAYIWQTGTPNADGTISWTNTSDTTATSYKITVSAATITSVYRCVTITNSTITAASDPVYLGGEAFFTWATTAEGVSEWLTDSATYAHVTVEYAVVAYEKYIGGIALSEVIHLITVTADTTTTTYLIELHGGTTLATMDANNQLIDERYHIPVATYDETTGVITALGN